MREQCVEPFVHDFEIVVLPFLPTFVDPEWSKGSIVGEGRKQESSLFRDRRQVR